MIINLYNNSTYISDSFSLPTEQDDLLDDRIQYGRLKSTDYFSGNKFLPIVCNIFPQSGILRFATPNPLRVLEFTGHYKVL